jgi:hypothetical protein
MDNKKYIGLDVHQATISVAAPELAKNDPVTPD